MWALAIDSPPTQGHFLTAWITKDYFTPFNLLGLLHHFRNCQAFILNYILAGYLWDGDGFVWAALNWGRLSNRDLLIDTSEGRYIVTTLLVVFFAILLLVGLISSDRFTDSPPEVWALLGIDHLRCLDVGILCFLLIVTFTEVLFNNLIDSRTDSICYVLADFFVNKNICD